jgi:hypothetical protein
MCAVKQFCRCSHTIRRKIMRRLSKHNSTCDFHGRKEQNIASVPTAHLHCRIVATANIQFRRVRRAVRIRAQRGRRVIAATHIEHAIAHQRGEQQRRVIVRIGFVRDRICAHTHVQRPKWARWWSKHWGVQTGRVRTLCSNYSETVAHTPIRFFFFERALENQK